jgi:hypothetical protein
VTSPIFEISLSKKMLSNERFRPIPDLGRGAVDRVLIEAVVQLTACGLQDC